MTAPDRTDGLDWWQGVIDTLPPDVAAAITAAIEPAPRTLPGGSWLRPGLQRLNPWRDVSAEVLAAIADAARPRGTAAVISQAGADAAGIVRLMQGG